MNQVHRTQKRVSTVKIIEKFSEVKDTNIIVLERDSEETNQLKKNLDSRIVILKEFVDSEGILAITDIFIGSGSTMTAEFTLIGISTISYNADPSIIEKYRIKKKLVARIDNINKLDE